jgi:hypothetical protein
MKGERQVSNTRWREDSKDNSSDNGSDNNTEGNLGKKCRWKVRAYNLKLPAIIKGGLFSLVRCISLPWILWG